MKLNRDMLVPAALAVIFFAVGAVAVAIRHDSDPTSALTPIVVIVLAAAVAVVGAFVLRAVQKGD